MIVVDNECQRLFCTEIVVDGDAYCDGCEGYNCGPEMKHLEDQICFVIFLRPVVSFCHRRLMLFVRLLSTLRK